MKTSVFFTIIIATLSLNLNAANPSKNLVFPSDSFLENLEMAQEENLEIANWMLDESTFESEYKFMEVKDWMLDETLFTNSMEIMHIEQWMLDESLFQNEVELLTVEDWMLNPEAFESNSQES